jgi:hypothetical protein
MRTHMRTHMRTAHGGAMWLLRGSRLACVFSRIFSAFSVLFQRLFQRFFSALSSLDDGCGAC